MGERDPMPKTREVWPARDGRLSLSEYERDQRFYLFPKPKPQDHYPLLCAEGEPIVRRNIYVIYGLVDATSPTVIRYVGRTRNYRERFRGHVMGTASTPGVRRWHDSLHRMGSSMQMVGLSRFSAGQLLSFSLMPVWEAGWIRSLRDIGEADHNIVIPGTTYGPDGVYIGEELA